MRDSIYPEDEQGRAGGVLPGRCEGSRKACGEATGDGGIGLLAGKRRLPNDVSRCPGTRCEVRDACARNTSDIQSVSPVFDFSVLGEIVYRTEACSSFISNKVEDCQIDQRGKINVD